MNRLYLDCVSRGSRSPDDVAQRTINPLHAWHPSPGEIGIHRLIGHLSSQLCGHRGGLARASNTEDAHYVQEIDDNLPLTHERTRTLQSQLAA